MTPQTDGAGSQGPQPFQFFPALQKCLPPARIITAEDAQTHEAFLMAIRAAVAERITDDAVKARVLGAKLLYGVGRKPGTRGGTFYGAWKAETVQEIIEVAAAGEESPLQLTGTMIHEIGHVIAGLGNGHGPAWKAAAKQAGLTEAKAAGQAYRVEDIDPALWGRICDLPVPEDGSPLFRQGMEGFSLRITPCSRGIGARGGRSRGVGSGSRLRLWICACPRPVKVRVASDEFAAHCDICGAAFTQPTEGV